MRDKKLDYRSLANAVGVSHAYLWQLVSADQKPDVPARRRKRPSRELIDRLAEALELDRPSLLAAAGYDLDDALPPAITRYETVNPDGRALYERGLEETRRGQPERGLLLLQQAASAEGVSFTRVHMALGVAYLNAKKYDAAIAEFEKVLDLVHTGQEPLDGIDVADVYYNLGLALQDSGRHSTAVAAFRRATRFGQAHADRYYAALTFSELALHRYHRVVAAALEFLEGDSENAHYTTASLDVRLFQAYAYALLGQFHPAVALAEATVVLCPRYWYAHYVNAAILSRYAGYLGSKKGKSRSNRPRIAEAAMRSVRRALALNPKGITDFQVERDGDFKAIRDVPEFEALVARPERQDDL